MSTNMTTVGRGAAVVGALLALKLIFGRRRKPKQNKEQTRELDSASMLQFREVQISQDINDSALDEIKNVEQNSTQEIFVPETKVVEEQQNVIHAISVDNIPRESPPIVVDLDVSEQDSVQLQLNKNEDIQQQDLQNVSVEFKVDAQNYVQVYFDGLRDVEEIMQQIQELQDDSVDQIDEKQQVQQQEQPETIQQEQEQETKEELEEELPQQNVQTVNVELKTNTKNDVEVYFDGKREIQEVPAQDQETLLQTNVEQESQQLLDQNDINLQTMQTDDLTTSSTTQIFGHVPDASDDQNTAVPEGHDVQNEVKMEADSVNETNEQLNEQIKFQHQTEVKIIKEEEEEDDGEDDEMNSMQVETSSQTTQFSIPEIPPYEKGLSDNIDYETIEEVPVENQENLGSQNIQNVGEVQKNNVGVSIVEQELEIEGLENQRVIETPSGTENKLAMEEEEMKEQNENIVVQSSEKQVKDDDAAAVVPAADLKVSDQNDQQAKVWDEEGEDEKLSQTEEDAQRMVAMANKLWGSGTPAEIKRAVKMQLAALEKLQDSGGRPVYLAQVASSLADMQYALNDLPDTRESLQVALNAANQTGDVALTSKLSNNLGQIMRQMKSFEAAKNLHLQYMERFEPEYGVGHHYTCLARQNLVESLEQLEQLDEAKKILEHSSQTCINAINELESPTAPDEEQAGVHKDGDIQDEIQRGEGEVEGEEGDGVDWTYICSGRVLTEQARFEVSHQDGVGNIQQAEKLLRLALSYIEKGEGVDGESSATPLSYLGKVLSMKGDADSLQEAYVVYERLRQISLKRDGENSQSVALVLHTQADVLGQLEKYDKAAELEEMSLKILRALLKQKYHLGLIKHFEALAKFKLAAGDGEGAQAASRDVLLCKKRHQEEQLKLKRQTSTAQPSASSSKSTSSPSKSASLSKSSTKRRSKDKKKAK